MNNSLREYMAWPFFFIGKLIAGKTAMDRFRRDLRWMARNGRLG